MLTNGGRRLSMVDAEVIDLPRAALPPCEDVS
jgi:hypothetical protein